MNKIRMLTEDDIVELQEILLTPCTVDNCLHETNSNPIDIISQFDNWIHNLRHDNKALKEFLEILVQSVSGYDDGKAMRSASIYITDTFDKCQKYTFLTICISCRTSLCSDGKKHCEIAMVKPIGEIHGCRWDNTLKEWEFESEDLEGIYDPDDCHEGCPQIQMRKEEDQFPNHLCKCEECKKEVALVLKKEKKQ